MTPPAWSDPYALTLAHEVSLAFRPFWPALRQVDPGIPFDELERLIDEAIELGASIEAGSPEQTQVPAAVGPLLPRMLQIVARARSAGARALDPASDRPAYLSCTLDYPLAHATVPPAGSDLLPRVAILNFGDTPAESERWRTRARARECHQLRVLYLYGNGLDSDGIGIDLSALPCLEALDLGDNRLRRLPSDVGRCVGLRWLRLTLNPLDEVANLTQLQNLRQLEIARTGLSERQIDELRSTLPRCHVVSGPESESN
jgi:hypothetical protein